MFFNASFKGNSKHWNCPNEKELSGERRNVESILSRKTYKKPWNMKGFYFESLFQGVLWGISSINEIKINFEFLNQLEMAIWLNLLK